ncbi:hypothetical protein DPMN_101397 [Dreissena polymorpha]|uniref:Uncharacterized protein n=1 Tax=Dreissena polymorpha TaxID=45954 RepID=A0A9D4LJD4_DREPO|nr:hypothetical protein DPMN_101397 [Dreissena polymorpha]
MEISARTMGWTPPHIRQWKSVLDNGMDPTAHSTVEISARTMVGWTPPLIQQWKSVLGQWDGPHRSFDNGNQCWDNGMDPTAHSTMEISASTMGWTPWHIRQWKSVLG